MFVGNIDQFDKPNLFGFQNLRTAIQSVSFSFVKLFWDVELYYVEVFNIPLFMNDVTEASSKILTLKLPQGPKKNF